MGKQIQAKRDNAIAMVKAGTWTAQDTYQNRDGMGAYTRGMLEPYEAQAKAAGLGIWANANQADRSAAANYRAPVKVAAKSDQRAAALGVDPRAYAASGGRVQTPIGNQATGNWGSAPTSTAPAGKLLPQTTPQPRATGFALQAVAPSPYDLPANKAKQKELDDLRGYAEAYKGTDAAAGYQARIDQLSAELEEAYRTPAPAAPQPAPTPAPRPVAQPRVDSLNSPYTYRAPGGGVVDPTLDQRDKFNPDKNANWSAPSGSTSLAGSPVSTPPPRALIPTESAYAGLQNRYDEAYTGRLLSAARSQAEREAANGAERLRKSMAERGLSQAGISGFEVQGLRDIEMARQNNLGRLSNEVYSNAADKATAFDTQRAGALDAFGMNRGNLSLGFSAEGRAGSLLPGALVAQDLANDATALSNDYTQRTMGDRISAVSAELYGRNMQNDRAAFELDESRAVAPMVRQQAALQLAKLQLEIAKAEQAGNRLLAQDLGTAAGKVAASGGFKWIGAGLGAVAGTLGPQALLGGTGWGAAGGMALGELLDRLFAPSQNPTGAAMSGGNAGA